MSGSAHRAEGPWPMWMIGWKPAFRSVERQREGIHRDWVRSCSKELRALTTPRLRTRLDEWKGKGEISPADKTWYDILRGQICKDQTRSEDVESTNGRQTRSERGDSNQCAGMAKGRREPPAPVLGIGMVSCPVRSLLCDERIPPWRMLALRECSID
jgi:hypothetical protein